MISKLRRLQNPREELTRRARMLSEVLDSMNNVGCNCELQRYDLYREFLVGRKGEVDRK